MNKLLGILPLLVLISVIPFAFAQEYSDNAPTVTMTVTTDQERYQSGDTIVITGKVRDMYSGTLVSVIVISPLDDLVSISQVEVGADKKFSTEMTAGGALMKYNGKYTVEVKYGTENRSATTTFYFEGSVPTPPYSTPQPSKDKGSITIRGHPDKIDYEVEGGIILSISADEDFKSLIVSINTSSDGFVILDIPRNVLDATFNGKEKSFIVLLDGDEPSFQELPSDYDSRKIKINFDAGSEEIEIIGSSLFTHQTPMNPPQPPSHSPCGAGTVFHPITDSCILINQPDPSKSKVIIVPDAGSSSPADDCVNVEYGCYLPGITTVDLGGVVIFSNTDGDTFHTFTAGDNSVGPTGEFDTAIVSPGNSYEWTADVVGEIPYFCMIHPWMDGMIIVNGGSGLPPNDTPPSEIVIPNYSNSEIDELKQKIIQLKSKNLEIKLENRQLKLQVSDLQTQVTQLEEDLENLMKQFVHDIAQITGWVIKLN